MVEPAPNTFPFVIIACVLLFTAGQATSVTAAEALSAKRGVVRVADADGGTKTSPRENAKSVAADKALEKSVLNMVKSHLPELQKLLDQLRKNEPRQYDLAIRNLAKSARRLEAAKKRDEKLFRLEVDVVKSQSAVNLLVAKLKVRDNQSDRNALRVATQQQHQAETARTVYEVAQLKIRIERTEQQLAAAQRRLEARQTDGEKQIERALTGHLRKAGRLGATAKPKTNPKKQTRPQPKTKPAIESL